MKDERSERGVPTIMIPHRVTMTPASGPKGSIVHEGAVHTLKPKPNRYGTGNDISTVSQTLRLSSRVGDHYARWSPFHIGYTEHHRG